MGYLDKIVIKELFSADGLVVGEIELRNRTGRKRISCKYKEVAKWKR